MGYPQQGQAQNSMQAQYAGFGQAAAPAEPTSQPNAQGGQVSTTDQEMMAKFQMHLASQQVGNKDSETSPKNEGRAGQPTGNTPSASADANAVLRNIIGVAQRAQIAQIAQITQQVQAQQAPPAPPAPPPPPLDSPQPPQPQEGQAQPDA